MTKYHRDLLGYAASIGIEGADIEGHGRHPHIVGSYAGERLTATVASTPRDEYRSRKNARADLRRAVRAIQEKTEMRAA